MNAEQNSCILQYLKKKTNKTLASIVSDVENDIAIKTEGELDTFKPEFSGKMKG